MDWMYLNDKKDDNNPILVIHDSECAGVWAVMDQKKGDDGYVIRRASELISRLGYMHVVIKSDQEPSMNEVNQKVRENLQKIRESITHYMNAGSAGQVVIVNSAVGDSAANQTIEHKIQRMQDQVRAIKLDVETHMKTDLHPSHSAWPWMIEYAAQTILMYRINNSDGLTSIQRIRGCARTTPKARFGEQILYKIRKTVRLSKTEPRWRRGVWFGTIESLDEHITGTSRGTIKCRSIAALPDTQRFSAEALNHMRCVPWRPSPSHVGSRLRTHIPDEDEEGMLDEEFEVEVNIHNDDDDSQQNDRIKQAQETQDHSGYNWQVILILREGQGRRQVPPYTQLPRVQVRDRPAQDSGRALADGQEQDD